MIVTKWGISLDFEQHQEIVMRKLAVVLFVMTAFEATVSTAQTASPASAANASTGTTVKYIQPGLVEVAGPRVNEVVGAGIKRITATPGKGWRSIVQSPWGDSYFGWPKNLKQVAFTIVNSQPAGGATISAPGLKDANKADYKAAIEAIIPFAIQKTLDNKKFSEGSR
jgi:hypothetical protein